ncbi:hypothetical protein ACFY4I_39610 [Streptomyces scabiei]|uniref:hypothetical protein n=1 Tax=Streptomyces scabiei TaxID=1930 RepID=UPI0036C84BF5
MTYLLDALPELLGGLGAAFVLAGLTWLARWALGRRNGQLRRYTLLSTVGPDGNPILHVTTRRAGTTITRDTGGQRERFELTDVLMPDGTYAAEPLDRYV